MCIDLHQTGSVYEGSDHLQLIKFRPCTRFGAHYNAECACLIQWSSHCRYLGVYLASGRVFKCSLHRSKCQFFKSLNAIFSKVGRFASEEVVLKLLRAKCLPVLLYGVESCLLLVLDKRSLDFTVTRSFMKLLRTGSAAVVDECQKFFRFLPPGLLSRYTGLDLLCSTVSHF